MRNILIIFSALALLFTACETDFNVNAAWDETIVVYGLLDASTDTQYIRINKAYLGEGDAIMMAQYSDSINFNPSSLDVIIYKLESNDTTGIVQLDTMLIIKDSLDINGNPGLFSIENNIIYSAVFPSAFFTSGNNYAIWIRNLDSGNQVWATTEVISDFSFKNTNLLINFPFGFYNPDLPDTSRVLSKTIEWNKSTNGTIYQLDLIFNYLESGVLKSLVWNQPLEYSEGGGPTMQSKLEGEKFFNFLSQNLTPDVNVIRQFTHLDLVMTVGTENLETYIKVNEPITGISQQRPSFTNINNGIGIFSSRFTHIVNNLDLSDDTKDYLINELGRNFQ